MLRQFEIAFDWDPSLLAFSAPIAVFVSVFLMYPLQSSWFFALIRSAAIFRFCCSSRFPQLDTQPLPHDGRCRCWVERCCVRFMAPQSKTRCLKTVMHPTPSVPLTRLKRKKPRWLPPTGSGHRFWDSLLQQALAALLHAVCASRACG